MGTGGEGGEGKQGTTADDPPPPAEVQIDTGKAMRPQRERRRWQRRKKRRQKIMRRGIGTEIPHGGARSRSLTWEGTP